MNKKITIGFMAVMIVSVLTTGYMADAQDDKNPDGSNFAATSQESTTATVSKEETIKQIENQKKQTEEKIKKESQDVVEAQKAIEEAEAEQNALKKEVELKEKEAQIAQKELEVLKEEAAVTNGSKSMQTVKELERKVEELRAEATAQKKKLGLAMQKEEIAEERLAKEQYEIDQVRQQLENLKIQGYGMASTMDKVVRSGVVLLVSVILFILLRMGIKAFESLVTRESDVRESEIELRLKTLGKLFNWLGGILIIIALIYQLMIIYGFNPGPLIAGAGVIGIAFGFGGQYLIRDLINGLFILVEGQYRINDVVKIGDLGGLVEDINLRITTLRDLAGRVIIIPNGEIKTVINFTKGYAQALMDIGVAYKENVDQVIEVIKQVGKEMREDSYFTKLILDDLEMLGVDDFADSAVMIKFRIKTKPIKQWEVSREFRRRLKNRFDGLGIEIPFPHRTLYWGTGDDNQWIKESVDKMVTKSQ
jgi:small conductance mechanosensitive channel